MTTRRKIIKALASLKLAVIIILALGVLTAWGTFVEAEYNDAVAAKKLVYHSAWMYGVMGLLAVTLIAVMVDRWPWRARHTGFVTAHIGIILILFGSAVTRYFGLDGSIQIGIGERERYVLGEDMLLSVYASLGDGGFRKLADRKVDFFLDRPTVANPYVVPLAGGDLKVLEYLPYAFRDSKIVESERQGAGPAVRFQLQNARVSLTEWLLQPAAGRDAIKDLGPAQVVLTQSKVTAAAPDQNRIVLRPLANGALEYEVQTAREPKKIKRGKIRPGESLDTGWMGLVLRVLKLLPMAEESISFKASPRSESTTTPAIRFAYAGREHWLGSNSMIKLFTDQAAYVVTYGNSRVDLGFDIELVDFRVGRYQGTLRAASYESLVNVPEVGERLISMNEPLKHMGYTFYQASFSSDDSGRPVASVLSVNRDPGRWIKYLGSLLIVFGTIHLFYFKRREAAAKKKAA